MFEVCETRPNVKVQPAEFNRLLGYPRGYEPEGRARELADEIVRWYQKYGRPWLYVREVADLDVQGGRVRLAGWDLDSSQLHEQFAVTDVRRAVVAAVSAGPECELLAQAHWREGKPDEYYFAEMYGSAIVESLITLAAGRLCKWADGEHLAALPHYSPGFSGWDVSDQAKLWSALQQGRTLALPGEIEVMTSGMLRPKKSLLALFGLTPQIERAKTLSRLIPCESCALNACQFRRAAYSHGNLQIKDVQHSQSMRTDLIS
jgi:hypothetical protein